MKHEKRLIKPYQITLDDNRTRQAFHFIRPLREAGEGYHMIAEQLNKEGYRTRRGKKFHPAQVRKI